MVNPFYKHQVLNNPKYTDTQKLRDKITMFYDDKFIRALTNQIVKIYACSLPKILIYEDGTMSTIHSKEVIDAVEKAESIRNEYIEIYYGQEFVTKININSSITTDE